MSGSERLADVLARLEAAYETARERLVADIRRSGAPCEPEEMRDSQGRYILLDALTALAQAYAAMAQLGGEALVARPGDTLILRMASNVSVERFESFRETARSMLKERMPGVEVLVIGGVEQIAAYRPDEIAKGDTA